MVNIYLIAPLIVSFFISLFFIPFWIRKAKEIGLVWDDLNKLSMKKVAGSGGIIAVLAFVAGVLVFVAYRAFILQTDMFLIETFAMLTVILLVAGLGLIDDLFDWRKGGIPIKNRLVFIALASVPLMAINTGRTDIAIPFIGAIDLGIIYSLVIIPIGIVGATTTFNFLAGFNGLESGQGILILSALSIVAFFTGSLWLTIISLCMVMALLGFLFYNFCPAKVFPGDSMTYAVGALIAIIAILGNFERIAIFFFIPFIIETFLKSRGKLKKQSFGKPNKEGGLDLRYNKLYSLNHVAILSIKNLGLKVTEKKVVYFIWSFQILIIIIGFIIFRKGIF